MTPHGHWSTNCITGTYKQFSKIGKMGRQIYRILYSVHIFLYVNGQNESVQLKPIGSLRYMILPYTISDGPPGK